MLSNYCKYKRCSCGYTILLWSYPVRSTRIPLAESPLQIPGPPRAPVLALAPPNNPPPLTDINLPTYLPPSLLICSHTNTNNSHINNLEKSSHTRNHVFRERL